MYTDDVMNTNELWQAVLGELELALSKANFTTWFKHTFIVSANDIEIVIGVPNLFTQAWLEKKYHREILRSLQTHTNHPIRNILYRVETKQNETTFAPVFEPTQNIETAKSISRPDVSAFHEQALSQNQQKEFRSGEFSLNGKYCFNTFVVGKQNELAHAAAQAVSNQPGGVYNPLLFTEE